MLSTLVRVGPTRLLAACPVLFRHCTDGTPRGGGMRRALRGNRRCAAEALRTPQAA
ncbi:hypothetical protein GCM10010519_10970 [Streptomyces lactacystinicus]